MMEQKVHKNTRQLGAQQEALAADYLERQGFRILARNFRCRAGEIDLIAEEDGCLVFVEVKYRTGLRKGYPMEAVHAAKQRTIYRVAQWYMQQRHVPENTRCRFDVVSILGSEVTLIRNAFGGF